MAFVKLEDKASSVECVFFSDSWGRSHRAVESGEPILVTGKVEERDGELKLQASSAEPLSEVRARSTRQVQLELRMDEIDPERLELLRNVFEQHPGNCEAQILISDDTLGTGVFRLKNTHLQPSVALEDAVHALFRRYDVMALI